MSLPNHMNLYGDLLPVLEKYGGTIKRCNKRLKILYNSNLLSFLPNWFKESKYGLKVLSFILVIIGLMIYCFPIPTLYTIGFIICLYLVLNFRLTYLLRKFKKDFIEALFIDNGISTNVNPKKAIL